ncbi:hypothetical protein ACJJTC_007012 [Scirpophaga incertulas]
MACGVGNLELVQLLLAHGADPFLSTQLNDGLCYSAAAQFGCYRYLHKRLRRHVLRGRDRPPGHNTGAARSGRAVLLQDFLQVCPSDDSHYSNQFIYECLPLLFNILRYSKKEGTVLLLADILCAVYGWEPPVPAVRADAAPPAAAPAPAPARVDPAYVNNPSLADVTFRVEGRLFYGHKIVLVSESPRLRAMLAPPAAAAAALAPAPGAGAAPGPAGAATPAAPAPPLVQINDIRYHIFERVMQYLYSGGCARLALPEADVLEVLAAASFFQLRPLQRYCEARAATTVDLNNLVSVYIHAKVYGATQLLEYCEGFLLQNMVALLTYDDSVKRLLFGKRLPGHNVLGGLLTTLQKRIEARKNQTKAR